MMPFAAFADNAIVCPACGGEVTKKPYHLVGNYWDFYKCNTCGKWAYLSGVAGLKLLSAGDQAIINAADANAILNFAFNNGHLIPAEKAPSGIGRKDLPGYASDDGTPNYNSSGELQIVVYPSVSYYDSSLKQDIYLDYPFDFHVSYNDYIVFYKNNNVKYTYFNNSGNTSGSLHFGFKYKFEAPLSGYYYISSKQKIVSKPSYNDDNPRYVNINAYHAKLKSGDVVDGYSSDLYSNFSIRKDGAPFTYDFNLLPIQYTVIPDIPTVTQQTNITINNNTWNGNIYTDNSTNLTYIYPQYTTVNEKNETVTNISNNPIIYNNETKKYYTYDTITNNYYYITYEQPTVPTPSPNPKPTWKPGGGSTRGGGVGRYPADPFTADWTLNYYILNNRRYDAYYALKRTEVDTKNNIPWIDDKHYISTTQIPIANGEYTISVSNGVYWRVWQWDEASKTLTGVNSSNWHGNNFTFLFNTTDEYIFEFCKSDGSEFSSPKDVVLKLKNEKITEYEPGDTIVDDTIHPETQNLIIPKMLSDLEEHKYSLTLRKAYKYYRVNMSNYASSMCSLSHFNLLGYDAKDVVIPTPSPSPTPAPTDKPGGGTIIVPGGGSGSGSGSGSGDNSWNPFKWLTDLLKDIVETILKGLWKLLTSIFGFILWLLSLLFKLFPWMPNSGILALCAGVVVVTVIRIIKFITGR